MQVSDRIGRRMKLHDIHVFMAVVQVGSMGKAATLLNTTQSAISRSIADLEGTVGVHPTYLGGIFDQFNTREYSMWSRLTEALRTGKPQTGIDDATHFAKLYSDPARFRTFVEAMTAGSLPAARAIATQFPWSKYESLLDVGTAQGCLPVQVARAQPHISARGFDLPELGGAFETYARDNGLSARLKFYPGNFFSDALPNADVVVFGRVLHNWDIQTKLMLLQKAYEALPVGGAVLVYDILIDDERRSGATGLLSSLNMQLWTAAGFGYSGADCVGWIRQVGFRETNVEPLVGGQSMVFGIK
jgi:predicted nicotinamide N-methyase